jgi:hypothetical protein
MRFSSVKSLKTNGEKMSVFSLSTISMKTNELSPSLHDVDEKKGETRWAGCREEWAVGGSWVGKAVYTAEISSISVRASGGRLFGSF